MQKKIIIGIYHKNCTDGTTAAAVLLRKFPNIILFSVSHSKDSTDEMTKKIFEIANSEAEIYFVDITSGAEELLKKDGYKITVIDHHIGLNEKMKKLAKENPNFTYIFNNEKSGASLAWDYLFFGEKEPEIIKYVEDSDLWKGKYGDDTKYVVNYLSTYADTPEKMLEYIGRDDIVEIKADGKIIADYTTIQMNRFIKNVESVDLLIGKNITHAYNLTQYEYRSYVGNKLSEIYSKTAVMFAIDGSTVKFSFRSKDGQNPSALELAKLIGGGGHRNASGAEIELKDFLQMLRVSPLDKIKQII